MQKLMTLEIATYLVELLGIKTIIVKKVEIAKNKASIVINDGKLIIANKVYNLNSSNNVAIIDINIQNFIHAYLGDDFELKSKAKQIILQLFDLPFNIPNNKIEFIGIKKKVFIVIRHNTIYYAVNLVNGQLVHISPSRKVFFGISDIDLHTVLVNDLKKVLFSLGLLVPYVTKQKPALEINSPTLNQYPQCIG